MTAAAIQRLSLSNFRSYHAASIDVSARLVVLTGPNGAGGTQTRAHSPTSASCFLAKT